MAQRARLVRLIQSAGLAALFLLAGRGTAGACTCIKEGTACGGLDTAEVVFEATVDTITSSEGSAGSGVFTMNRVAFSSIRRFRGQAADFVLTNTEESACGFLFSRGERYLVFAHRRADGNIIVSRCSLTRLAAGAEPLIAALQQPFNDRSSVVFGTLKGETATTRMAPLGGARIVLQGPINRSLMTAPDGTFVTTDLPVGHYRLLATPPSSLPHLWPAGAALELNFRSRCSEHFLFAASRGLIRGQVVDAAGRPAAGAHVQLLSTPGPWGVAGVSLSRLATTDSRGRYEFSRLGAGSYSVGINLWQQPSAANPYQKAVAPTAAGEDYFPLSLGGEVVVPVLTVVPLQRVLKTVRVQHADGRPATRLRVTLSAVGIHDARAWEPRPDASAVSDDSGTVTVEVWQSVPYLVRVGSVGKPLVMKRLDGTAESIALVVP